jgi:hypothetical protein
MKGEQFLTSSAITAPTPTMHVGLPTTHLYMHRLLLGSLLHPFYPMLTIQA